MNQHIHTHYNSMGVVNKNTNTSYNALGMVDIDNIEHDMNVTYNMLNVLTMHVIILCHTHMVSLEVWNIKCL